MNGLYPMDIFVWAFAACARAKLAQMAPARRRMPALKRRERGRSTIADFGSITFEILPAPERARPGIWRIIGPFVTCANFIV